MRITLGLTGILLLATVPYATAATIVVPDDVPSIQGAMTTAQPGDVIRVKPGDYRENILFKNGVRLEGEGFDVVRVYSEYAWGPCLLVCGCAEGTISGITFEQTNEFHAEPVTWGVSPVVYIGGSNVTFSECVVRGGASNGLVVEAPGSPTIQHCLMRQNAWQGVVVAGRGASPNIIECECSDNGGNGVTFSWGAAGTAVRNGFRRNGQQGIEVFGKGTTLALTENECTENKTNGAYFSSGARVEATDNRCLRNAFHGISFEGGGVSVKLTENTCSENGWSGIFFGPEAKGAVESNLCENNKMHGILVNGNAREPVVRTNRTVKNGASGIWLENELANDLTDNESLDNGEICAGEVGWLFAHERFAELEALAGRLRTEKTRFKSGEWQLGYFYDWIAAGWDKATPSNSGLYFNLLRKWSKAYPESVAPRVVAVKAYTELAWEKRGGGWAREVTAEGWKGFSENLNMAWKTYEEAEQLEQKDPALYGAAITTAMGLGEEDPTFFGMFWQLLPFTKPLPTQLEKTFNKGVELEPTYYPLYYARAVALLPRWGGGPGELEAFAASSAERTKDLEGDALYTRIAKSALDYVGIDEFLDGYGFSWPRIKQGFEDSLKAYPDSTYLLSYYLYFATQHKDQETARMLVERIGEHWDHDFWGTEQRFLLHKNWATGNGPFPIWKLSVEAAIEDEDYREAERLLKAGEDVNARNEKGETALYNAVITQDARGAALLLKYEADPDIPNYGGDMPLYLATIYHWPEIVKLLVENGAGPNVTLPNGWTPLTAAAYWGFEDCARLLLDNGADANNAMANGWPALGVAIQNGNNAIAKLLLERGANPNAKDEDGASILEEATETANADVIRLLIAKGADVMYKEQDGWTAIHMATWNPDVSVLSALLEAPGVDVNVKTESLDTPLHQAARKGQKANVELLLSRGAEISARNKEDKTPLDMARENDHPEIVELLRQRGGTE